MAVSPLLSTALMSAPRSSATCTASNTSLSVPASSPGERVPRPAATISGVALSAFGNSGSAPSAASSPHQLGVGGSGGQQERRRAHRIQTGQSQVHLPGHARVQVRSMLLKLLDNLEAGHVPGTPRRGVVIAAARLADSAEGVQGRITRARRHSDRRPRQAVLPRARNARW